LIDAASLTDAPPNLKTLRFLFTAYNFIPANIPIPYPKNLYLS
jgi:hypothetical protein